METYLKHIGATKEDIEFLTSMPESDLLSKLNVIDKMGIQQFEGKLQDNIKLTMEYLDMYTPSEVQKIKAGMDFQYKLVEIYKKYFERMKSTNQHFKEFMEEQGYFSGLHSETPWLKLEMSMNALRILAESFDTWGKISKDNILEFIQSALEQIPKNKSFNVDVSRLLTIIKESETPSFALKRVEKELKLKPIQTQLQNIQDIKTPEQGEFIVLQTLMLSFG